jgi:hypothetical protein
MGHLPILYYLGIKWNCHHIKLKGRNLPANVLGCVTGGILFCIERVMRQKRAIFHLRSELKPDPRSTLFMLLASMW